MKNNYKTKQQSIIIDYLKKCGNHTTAAEIVSALGGSVSTATVYRHLEKLVTDGMVRKYITAGCACYQYAPFGCEKHFHLKCTACGTLYHVDCSFLSELSLHILNHHSFKVDDSRTVMYGICEKCTAASIGGAK